MLDRPSASIMASDDTTAGASPSRQVRCALRFSIDGDLRFISHQDTLRLFKRAVARAALPVRFTKGFNPQPSIKIPVPRPLGIESQDETILIEFEEEVGPDEVIQGLASQMPRGIQLLDARELSTEGKLTPIEALYRLRLERESVETLALRAESLLNSDELIVTRTSPKYRDGRLVDIKPFIASIEIGIDVAEFALRITSSGGARPTEVAQLLGFGDEPVNHRIERIRVRWQKETRQE